MRKVYKAFCRLEEIVTSIFLCTITLLVFLSAVARTIRHPLNWSQDISLLLFAWTVFLGADVALRDADFINVEMIIEKFPQKIQDFLYYLWNIIILIFLAFLIRFGVPLSIENSKRLFQTLGISYSWATISVPVGALLMMITIILRLISKIRKDKRERMMD